MFFRLFHTFVRHFLTSIVLCAPIAVTILLLTAQAGPREHAPMLDASSSPSDLAKCAASFVVVALMLAATAALVINAFEDLWLRSALTTRFFREWLDRGYSLVTRYQRKLHRVWFEERTDLADGVVMLSALPIKQFVGTLASRIQQCKAVNQDYAMTTMLSDIGASLVRQRILGDENSSKDNEIEATDTLSQTERALDDLQVFLERRWMVARYLMSYVVNLIGFTILYYTVYVAGNDHPVVSPPPAVSLSFGFSILLTPYVRTVLLRLVPTS
jgi:hypothetical protein